MTEQADDSTAVSSHAEAEEGEFMEIDFRLSCEGYPADLGVWSNTDSRPLGTQSKELARRKQYEASSVQARSQMAATGIGIRPSSFGSPLLRAARTHQTGA